MTARLLSVSTALLLVAAACGGSITEGSASDGPDAGAAGSGGTDADARRSCVSDRECAAPTVCEVCPDGVSHSCATGKCTAGGCEVVYPPCPTVDAGACPADAPIGGACAGDLHCTYGAETCCGQTHPSTVCDCIDGRFACYATDACLLPPGSCGNVDAGAPFDASAPTDAGSGPSCKADSDCMTPDICKVCPDGKSYSCATGACLDGACETVFPGCPPPTGGGKVMCGGFAGLRCPGIGRCVDDPTDSCDPKRGDADCAGLCKCSGATVDCMPGYVFDASPAVCTCVPDTNHP